MWKYSFELVTRESDLAKKKKQALDELFGSNKISQSTYECLNAELNEAITDLESHLSSLKDKMKTRAQELEKQICTLELFLANLEIHHAAGEIDDEAYQRQNMAILLGLETTKQELADIRTALSATVAPPVETLPTPGEPKPEQDARPAEGEASAAVSLPEQTATQTESNV